MERKLCLCMDVVTILKICEHAQIKVKRGTVQNCTKLFMPIMMVQIVIQADKIVDKL